MLSLNRKAYTRRRDGATAAQNARLYTIQLFAVLSHRGAPRTGNIALMLRFVLIPLLLLLPAQAARAILVMDEHEVLVVDEDTDWLNITPELPYIVDPSAAWDIDDVAALPPVQFEASGHKSLALGVNPGRVWMRLELENHHSAQRGLVVELNNARLESVELFYPDDNGGWQCAAVGTNYPVEDRIAKHLLPALLVPVPPGKSMVCYLAVHHSGSTRFQVHLASLPFFRKLVTDRTAANFIVTGGMLAMVIFNLVVFLQLRGYVWVWQDAHWWSGRAVTTTSMLHQMLLGLFFCFFMRPVAKDIRWILPFARGMSAICAALAVLALTDWSYKYYPVSFFGGLAPILFEIAALYAWRRGYRPAGHFAVAWGISVVGGIYLSCIQLGMVEHSYLRESIVPIGYLISVVIWNISLAERIRVSERNAREQLESQVRERTQELQQALDEVKTLSGLLPICSECKKIRDDKGYWQGVEQYIREHTDARFTHGMCPDCFQQMYPHYAERVEAMDEETPPPVPSAG
jgi:hypothetical protein